jgi:hypothetical protein
MTDTAKVVRLDIEKERLLRTRLARLPPEIHAALETGKHAFGSQLAVFFDRLDDRFFALADQATGHQEQNLFFDAMRDFRAQRRTLEKRLTAALDEAFARLESTDAAGPAETVMPENLALVQPEELEEMVALEAMLAQAHRQYADPLAQLSFRFDGILAVKVYAKNNPLSPDVFCQALSSQCKQLNLAAKARLVVYQQFESAVIAELGDLYRQVLVRLSEFKLPPSLREAKPVPAATAPAPQEPAVKPSRSQAGQSQFDDELASLLNDMSRGIASRPLELINHTLPLASLVELLTRVQRETKVVSGIADVRNLVAAFNEQRGHHTSLSRMDTELIHLVNLLFDFILQDQNLAEPVKLLLSRLQIPIIKVALVDKGFFTQNGHVARRLLNDMALAGVGWNGDRADPLFQMIDTQVERILREFDADLTVFSQCLAEFSAFVEREKRRAALFEKRTLDVEEGKSKSEQARQTVANEVGLRTQGFVLTKPLQAFIAGPWSQVLFVRSVRLGFDAPLWQQSLKTLTDLVWSSQPLKSPQDRHALIDILPQLLADLRQGLEEIACHPFEMAAFFKHLDDIHLQSLSRPLAVPAETAVVLSPPSTNAQEVTLSPSDSHWKQVAAFVPGAWFDLQWHDQPSIRCRLAAVIKQTGNHIFVNRSGVKVAERSHQQLALALKSGELRPLDNSLLFDRALEEVVSGLRKSQKMALDFSVEPPKNGH